MSVALGLLSAAAVTVVLRPASRPARPTGRQRRPRRPRVADVLVGLGRPLRRGLGLAPGRSSDLRVGVAIVLVCVAVAFGPAPALAAGCGGGLLLRWRRLRTTRAATSARDVAADLPDLVDLLVLTVGAGLTVSAALPVVARWSPPGLRPAVLRAERAIASGVPVADAVTAMAVEWGDHGRPLARALTDHVRDGTPLLPVLHRIGHEARGRRRRMAESRARRLPVLLLFPLVLCTLPAFGLLTVAPILAGTLRSLDGERLEASASPTLRSEEPPCKPSSSPPTSRPCPSPTAPPSSPPP